MCVVDIKIYRHGMTKTAEETILDRLKIAEMNIRDACSFLYWIIFQLKRCRDDALPAPMGVDESTLTLYYNITFMEHFINDFTVDAIAYIYMHEALHVANRHGIRRGNRNPELWNIACDIAINSQLTDYLGLPLPKNALYVPDFKGLSAEEIYEILSSNYGQKPPPPGRPPKGRPPKGQPPKKGKGRGHGPWVEYTDIPDDPDIEVKITYEDGTTIEGRIPKKDLIASDKTKKLTEGEKKLIEDYIKHVIQRAKTEAEKEYRERRKGVAPGNIEGLIKLTEPEVDWRSELSEYFHLIKARAAGYTWSYPSRRALSAGTYMPARVGEKEVLRVAIAIDTSGSISDAELQTFLSETLGIINDIPDTVALVIQTDAIAHTWQEYRYGDFPPELAITGRGGSNTIPTFEKIEELEWMPDVLVYFTDLEVDFPDTEPDYPVLWITIGQKTTAPFGEVRKYRSLIR